MKLVNWNIEWMNNWFVGNNKVSFRDQYVSRGNVSIENVPALAQRVANAIIQMNPDVTTIQEGPSDLQEMDLFCSQYLIDSNGDQIYSIIGSAGKGAQKLYALVKKDGEYKDAALLRDELTLELEESWLADVDGDMLLEEYDFTRVPLVVTGKFKGENVIIIALHTKSKFVQGQVQMWKSENRKQDFIVAALKNRRRIASEGFRLRTYLNELLKNNPIEKVIVTGDWNDGPGNDYFERNYLVHNVSDIILGSTFYPQFQFVHSFLNNLPIEQLYTAVFDDFVDEIPNRKILLDHIVVSPGLKDQITDSGIEHTIYEQLIDPNATTEREKAPSDHRPIYLTL